MVGDKARDKHWGSPEQWAPSRRVSKTLLLSLFFFFARCHPSLSPCGSLDFYSISWRTGRGGGQKKRKLPSIKWMCFQRNKTSISDRSPEQKVERRRPSFLAVQNCEDLHVLDCHIVRHLFKYNVALAWRYLLCNMLWGGASLFLYRGTKWDIKRIKR